VSGIDHDTAAFAVNSIRRWWYALGCACGSVNCKSLRKGLSR
jgi:hypothetical protein